MFSRLVHNSLLGGVVTAACLVQPVILRAADAVADWPGFRGGSNGIAPELAVTDVSKASLSNLWKVETPTGFSSFTVGGTQVFTVVKREEEGNPTEVLLALDVRTGKELWAAPLSIITKYDGGGDDGAAGNKGGDGPRSTPAFNDGIVYVTDANLVVYAIDAKTGKEVWKRNVMKENGGKNIRWQNAASPVIDGEVVLLAGGGKGEALLGLDKKTGKEIWKGEDDAMTHATPVIAEIHGVKQCIFFTQRGLVAVDPQKGTVLWRGDFPYKISTAASPVVFEDIVYCSAGYGVGAGAFKVSKKGSDFSAEMIWRRENECFNHWSTPVVKEGYLYGMFSFKQYAVGPVACVDIRTGKDMWQEQGFGPGQVILSGNTLIALSDKGEVVFIEANPKGYKELKRESLVEGKVWSYPVLAYNRIFARSTVEGGCWELK